MIDLSGTVVLVGAGKMGGAMLEGWLTAGTDPRKIMVIEPHASAEMRALVAAHGVALNPAASHVSRVDVIVVAVKPQALDEVLPTLVPLLPSKPLILSVVAGKTIASFAKALGNGLGIIRTIPNTPAAVGRGITAIVANNHVSASQLALAEALLATIGEVVTVDREDLIDCVTAVSGSGPAYIFLMTECLARAGEELGLPPPLAMQLARATVAGSGELMRVTGTDAAALRKNVTSPNGTTFAALEVLMADNGLQPLMTRAVKAAFERSRALAK
jgi:pyrroline-5-carboxylate reductase